jgi:hypothetical protein
MGKIEKGDKEDPIATALREFNEETNGLFFCLTGNLLKASAAELASSQILPLSLPCATAPVFLTVKITSSAKLEVSTQATPSL